MYKRIVVYALFAVVCAYGGAVQAGDRNTRHLGQGAKPPPSTASLHEQARKKRQELFRIEKELARRGYSPPHDSQGRSAISYP